MHPPARLFPTPGGNSAAERMRLYTRLVPMWPRHALDDSLAGRRRRLSLLERALRRERQRGLSGHWTYDLARHAQLLALYRQEKDDLARLASRRPDREHETRQMESRPRGPASSAT